MEPIGPTTSEVDAINPSGFALEAPAAFGRKDTIWSTIREGFVGSHRDYTAGSLNRAIVVLAIPMVLEMAMESLFSIVDVFFVARVGATAIATVGLTESLLILLYGTAIGLSIATTAFVARRIGEKDPEDAAVGAVQAIVLAILISLAVSIIGIFLAPTFLGLMGADAAVIRDGGLYTRIMLGAAPAIFLIFIINSIFRGAGDASFAMRTLWLGNAINIVLDPCLINGWLFFPKLGVTGAAVATSTGRSIAVLFGVYILLNGKGRVALAKRHFQIRWEVMWRILRVSLSGIVQFVLATGSWLGIVRLVSHFGNAAVAGYTIGIRIIIFSLLPSWGMCNAAATLVGQNLGAGKPERSETAVYRTGIFNMIYLGTLSAVFVIFSRELAGFFTQDPAVLDAATLCLHILGWGNLSYCWGQVMTQAFNGAGDTQTPTVLNASILWVFQIPFAYWMGFHTSLGERGVFYAVLTADTLYAIVALILFRRGTWKLQKI